MGRVRLVQIVSAKRQLLWRTCATAEGLETWQADQVRGSVAAGKTITLSWPRLSVNISLDVERVVEGRFVSYRNGKSLTRFDVEDGSVTLTHKGLDEGDDIEGFASSWRVALATLALAATRFPGRRRATFWFTQSVKTTAETAHLFFTDPDGLASWLGTTSGIGALGSEYAVTLDSGRVVSGRVLARVRNRDVALSWDEQEALITLRTLPAPFNGDKRVVALCVSCWGAPIDPTMFTAALSRLARVLATGGRA